MSPSFASNDLTDGHWAYSVHFGVRPAEPTSEARSTAMIKNLSLVQASDVEADDVEVRLVDQDLSVDAVATRLMKSPRQIQRLLKDGKINGYKIAGPKGPEWRVRFADIEELVIKAESLSVSPQFQDKLDDLDAKLGAIKSKFEMLRHTAASLEAELCRISEIANVESENCAPSIEDCVSASVIESVESVMVVESEPAPSVELEENAQPKWWKRWFASVPKFLKQAT